LRRAEAPQTPIAAENHRVAAGATRAVAETIRTNGLVSTTASPRSTARIVRSAICPGV